MKELLPEVYHLNLSQGTIDNILRETNRRTEPAIRFIKDWIERTTVIGYNESGCYCNGKLQWSWIVHTPVATLAFMAANKSSEVLKNMFGDNLKNQIAVTDRHSAYFKLDFKNHQVRLVHILRELEYLTELDTK